MATSPELERAIKSILASYSPKEQNEKFMEMHPGGRSYNLHEFVAEIRNGTEPGKAFGRVLIETYRQRLQLQRRGKEKKSVPKKATPLRRIGRK